MGDREIGIRLTQRVRQFRGVGQTVADVWRFLLIFKSAVVRHFVGLLAVRVIRPPTESIGLYHWEKVLRKSCSNFNFCKIYIFQVSLKCLFTPCLGVSGT